MAHVGEALVAAQGMHGYVAFRPTGLVLGITRRGALMRFDGARWRQWWARLEDVVASDWGWGLLDNVMAQIIAQNAPPPEERS
jgi:hypothetical protein